MKTGKITIEKEEENERERESRKKIYKFSSYRTGNAVCHN